MPVKSALIVGASRAQGLGFAVAKELAELSFHVLVTSRTAQHAKDRAEELRKEGFAATGIALDVTDDQSVRACADKVRTSFGHLDALINNHSVVPDFGASSVLQADPDNVRGALDTDVVGTLRCTLSLLPLLLQAPAARVVNVSSQDALRVSLLGSDAHRSLASPGFSLAKFTLNALTNQFASALRDTSVLVNAVDPGETATHPETGDEGHARPAAISAHGVVWAATLGPGGPTGGFFRDQQPLY